MILNTERLSYPDYRRRAKYSFSCRRLRIRKIIMIRRIICMEERKLHIFISFDFWNGYAFLAIIYVLTLIEVNFHSSKSFIELQSYLTICQLFWKKYKILLLINKAICRQKSNSIYYIINVTHFQIHDLFSIYSFNLQFARFPPKSIKARWSSCNTKAPISKGNKAGTKRVERRLY